MTFTQILLLRQGTYRGLVYYCVIVTCIFAFYLTATRLAVSWLCPDLATLPPDNLHDFSAELKASPKSVAVLIMATGHYAKLAEQLIASARFYFCPGQAGCSNVTYLLFTDAPQADIPFGTHINRIAVIPQRRLGWPHDTMKRYHTYLKHDSIIEKFDFVMALDADLKFVSNVHLSEVYGDMFAVLHPGYMRSWPWHLPFEKKHSQSKAYVKQFGSCRYFTGAIWGGRSGRFLTALRTLVWQVDSDAAKFGVNFTTVWHDESHLNRYLIDNPPSRILTPSYYYPEDPQYKEQVKQFPKKIVALNKDYKKMRDLKGGEKKSTTESETTSQSSSNNNKEPPITKKVAIMLRTIVSDQ